MYMAISVHFGACKQGFYLPQNPLPTISWSCNLEGVELDWLVEANGNDELFVTVALQKLLPRGSVEGVAQRMVVAVVQTLVSFRVH